MRTLQFLRFKCVDIYRGVYAASNKGHAVKIGRACVIEDVSSIYQHLSTLARTCFPDVRGIFNMVGTSMGGAPFH